MTPASMTDAALPTVLRGVVLMIGAAFLFSCLDTTAKFLGQSMPPVEVAWARFAVHVVIAALVWRVWARPHVFRAASVSMQLLRALCMLGATAFNFGALRYMPLAQAAAIMFAAPLLVTALSGPLLGEWAGPRRWAAVMVGFIGVLIVTRPGIVALHWSIALSLCAMVSFAFYSLLTRRMGGSETSESLLMWSGIFGAVVLSPVAAAVFVPPAVGQFVLFLAMGLFGFTGHYALVLAHKVASPTVLAPFIYSQMVWMIVFGFIVFGDVPDLWTLIGAAVIASSGLYILHRERVRGKLPSVRDPAVQ